MKKCFIFWICGECNLPVGIVAPCKELGYNAFPYTNFHGELSVEKTEQMKLDLIKELKGRGKFDKAKDIQFNTKVLSVYFEQNTTAGITTD